MFKKILVVVAFLVLGAIPVFGSEWTAISGPRITGHGTLEDATGYIEGTWVAVGPTITVYGEFDGQGEWDSDNERWVFTDADWWSTSPTGYSGYWSGWFDIGGADDGTAQGTWRTADNKVTGLWSATRDE